MREAIVLAGGLGTRLRSVLPHTPKPMAPVAGRPFLEILLGQLAHQGFSHVVLALGHRAEQIRSHFGSQFAGMALTCVVEPEPLGTGGAQRLALDHCRSARIHVLNGDTYLEFDANTLEAGHKASSAEITIVCRPVDDTARYGRVLCEGSRILGFSEKGISGPGLINAGTYLLERQAIAAIPAGRFSSFEQEVLPPAIARGAVAACVSHGLFIDIGIPADYARAQELLADLP